MKRKLTLILAVVFISLGFWQLLEPSVYSQNKPLTLEQVKNSLNVSPDKKKESAITAKKVRQVGVNFPLTPEIECELPYYGATNELIEAIRQNSPSLPTPSTVDMSNETIIAELEESWNYYARQEIFLGPNYFGNTTSFGRSGDSNYALELMSDYPTYHALARKGLIKLDEFSISDVPPAGLPSYTSIERAATVTLTQAGAKFGNVNLKKNTVTFVFGTYRVEKIESNTAVDTNYGNYRLIQGTHVFDLRQDFRDVWSQSGNSTYRERRFRVIFKYVATDDFYKSIGKSWTKATASNCRFSAADVGPRNGDFESANVPPTLDQLRLKPKSSLSQTKQSNQTVEIIVEKANLRESPNASSKIIREVKFGERFFLSDIQPVGAWYKVVEAWTGKEGWLHGNTFKIVKVNKSDNPKTFKNSIGMEFVYITSGSFEIGSSEGEKPIVTISSGFYMGKYEVTQEDYEKVMGTNPSYFKNCPRCPVENVSWDDTQDFVRKLNAKNEGVYRLPTEAEWEYAAKAGTTTKWSFGDDENQLDIYAWYSANSGYKTHEVGTKQPNDFGLYDMHGNMSEWVQDRYASNYYAKSSATDPMGPSENIALGKNRVVRGGNFGDDARFLHSVSRGFNGPSVRNPRTGFRLFRQ